MHFRILCSWPAITHVYKQLLRSFPKTLLGALRKCIYAARVAAKGLNMLNEGPLISQSHLLLAEVVEIPRHMTAKGYGKLLDYFQGREASDPRARLGDPECFRVAQAKSKRHVAVKRQARAKPLKRKLSAASSRVSRESEADIADAGQLLACEFMHHEPAWQWAA